MTTIPLPETEPTTIPTKRREKQQTMQQQQQSRVSLEEGSRRTAAEVVEDRVSAASSSLSANLRAATTTVAAGRATTAVMVHPDQEQDTTNEPEHATVGTFQTKLQNVNAVFDHVVTNFIQKKKRIGTSFFFLAGVYRDRGGVLSLFVVVVVSSSPPPFSPFSVLACSFLLSRHQWS